MDQRPVKFLLARESVANNPELTQGLVIDSLGRTALLLLGQGLLNAARQLFGALDVMDPAVQPHALRRLVNGVLDLARRERPLSFSGKRRRQSFAAKVRWRLL